MRLAVLLVVVVASTSQADRREVYIQLETGLGIHLLKDAATAAQPGSAFGPAGQLHIFYGVTNELHLGGYARGYYAPDVAFQNVTPTLADRSMPTGTLYENAFGAGGGALVRWRFDTGVLVAPFLQLELGASWARFERLQLIPEGQTFGVDLPARDEFAPEGRIVGGLEVRLGELFVISLHLGGRHVFNGVSQWQLDVGIATGVVF